MKNVEKQKQNLGRFKKLFQNKKIIGIVILSVIIFILVFIISIKPKIELVEAQKNALEIGEEKYLNFLWMVDGAFNDIKYKENFTVNGHEIKEENKKFLCEYQNNSETCISKDFENAFSNLFIQEIAYNYVYGDGLAVKWYQKIGDEYHFKNNNSGKCNIKRMSKEHKLEVKDVTSDKIVYEASFTDIIKDGIYKGTHDYKKEFVLEKENGDWKISKAYYHDPCFMEYNIEKND